MTDSDPTAAPQDSALRPAESDLHPADAADDLTANTPTGAGGDLRDGDTAAGDPDDLGDPGDPGDLGDLGDLAVPGDRLPGDGSVAHDRPEQPDAMRTATQGRESASARADLSDDRPTPTATPAD